ncbi:MAG TPA: serine/threonine-protein kinase [Vicinamibacteria bacterium]|nr:serine/threonine-protein kinase [Vicinamibacteria bacterium]
MTSFSAGASQGRRIGRYVVTGRIGRGGMGMVYRGYDAGLDREVAVKTLSLEATLEEEHRKRFEIEARAAAKLQHPNIVTVFELGDDRGVPFIAMELLAGADLETLLRSGEPLLLQEQLDIMIQVCRGLHFAHERKVVHRDIKPSNIRVLEDGTAKIMDFGIAKLAGSGVTKSGMVIGTVHYMSPEQVLGRPLDGRSDIFSVGVILYELLSGKRPFTGESPTEVLYKIVHDATPTLPEGLGAPARALHDVVARSLAKEPAQRPAAAGRLADELSQLLAAHLRDTPAGAPTEVIESVSQWRRHVQEGRVEESLQRLREVTQRHPQSLEARRALRWASREIAQREARPSAPDEFADLDAKFLSAPTRREPETVLHAAPPGPAAGPPRSGRRADLKVVGALAAALAVLVAAVAVLRQPPREPLPPANEVTPAPTPVTAVAAGPQTPAAVAEVPLSLVSDPTGAAVSVDGQTVRGTTPLSVPIDPTVSHRIVVWRDGYASQELRTEAGRAPPELRVRLQSLSPPGKLAVTAAYPVDVVWRGRVLARGQTAPEVSLPSGPQVVTLVAAAHFLRLDVPVEVRASESVSVSAPPLGRLNIRAQPDNCRVFIDGAFVDYPPILEKQVAVGKHAVAFEWPDGARREHPVEVTVRAPAYVTGRKD